MPWHKEKNLIVDKMEELRMSLINSGKLKMLVHQFQELQQEENIDEMFKLIWELEEGHQYLKIPMEKSNQKSENDAVKFRKIGNEYYQNKDLSSALSNYNLSIMAAPHPDITEEDDGVNCTVYKELSLGYEHRSAVLIDLKQYERAIYDIDNAIKLNNAEDNNYNLLERKVRCLIEHNNIQEANAILEKLILELYLKDKVDAELTSITNKLHNLKKRCNQLNESTLERNDNPETDHMKSSNHFMQSLPSDDLLFNYTDPIVPELDAHPTIPSFSKALTLSYATDKGRFVVAEKDIKPGELVAVEEAYTCTVNTNDITKQRGLCCTCLRRCDAPLPCPQCNMIIFCSEQCRLKGWNNFHKKECQILPTILSLGFPATDNLVQALRILFKTECLDFKNILREIKNRNLITNPLVKGFNKDGVFDSLSYESVYNLVGHVKDRDPELLICLCYWVFIVMKILIESEQYYVDREGTPFIPNNEDILPIGSCLLRNITNIYCNCFGINETQHNVKGGSFITNKIGAGLYTTIGLFNHSCNPSVMNYTYGNMGVCYALRFIPAGEEVTTKYGKMYCFEKDVEARRTHLLNSYHFTCACEACVNNWQPDSTKPPELRPHMERIYRSTDEDQHFEAFTKENNDLTLKLENEMEEIFELDYNTNLNIERTNADLNEYIPTLSKIIEFLDRFAIKPDIVLIRSQMNLIKCLRNKRQCINFKR